MIIKVTKGDLNKQLPITPGWYKGRVRKAATKSVEGKVNGDIQLEFEDQMLAADDRYLDHTFYNMVGKGIGFLIPYIGAILNRPIKDISDSIEKGGTLDFDFDKTEGEKIQFYVANDPFEGRIINKVKGFLPYSSEPPQG